ncbi:MAG: DUF4440 domain-containing protein [Bacteroidetes bacterium]|nr:MAG: DUF4440 domain-containing protein [Bacteroidota bacterium]
MDKKKSELLKIFSVIFFILVSLNISAQNKDEIAIRNILDEQTQAWNDGNLEKFMKGYWNNDSLMFIGSAGIIYGYQQTLERYKHTYSDTAKMGKLTFHIITVKKLSEEYYYIVGQWFLKRSVGDVGGYYNLLFRKIKGEWKIIADHSS